MTYNDQEIDGMIQRHEQLAYHAGIKHGMVIAGTGILFGLLMFAIFAPR